MRGFLEHQKYFSDKSFLGMPVHSIEKAKDVVGEDNVLVCAYRTRDKQLAQLRQLISSSQVVNLMEFLETLNSIVMIFV